MQSISLGTWGSLRKLIKAAKHDEEFSIIATGWRRKILIPHLRQLMSEAIDVPKLTREIESMQPKWSLGSVWLGWWAGPLMAIYRLALERNMTIIIRHGEPTSIQFINERTAKTMREDIE